MAVPNTFSAGTLAKSSEVNENFDYLDGLVSPTFSAIFGDGSDGDLNITSGTTTINQGVTKYYSSINIDAGTTLTTSTTYASPLTIIYCSGDCIINGDIDFTGKSGLAGGAGTTAGYTSLTAGQTHPTSLLFDQTMVPSTAANAASTKLSKPSYVSYHYITNNLFSSNDIYKCFSGIGGTGGGGILFAKGPGGSSVINDGDFDSSGTGSGTGTGGTGGAGGGGLLLIVGGNLTFGASSNIITSGANGSNGSSSSGTSSGGGGGGGAGGQVILYAGTLTDNGVTQTAAGGIGGFCSAAGSLSAQKAGDGGAGYTALTQL